MASEGEWTHITQREVIRAATATPVSSSVSHDHSSGAESEQSGTKRTNCFDLGRDFEHVPVDGELRPETRFTEREYCNRRLIRNTFGGGYSVVMEWRLG